jgi:hypothetical protein
MASPGDKLYVAPGSLDATWTAQFNNDGLFVFTGGRWSARQDANVDNAKDLVAVAVDPTDTSHVYLGSWGKGVVHLHRGQFVERWDATNSPLGPALASTSNDVRVGGLTFAQDGTLWATASLATNNLYKRTPDGTWTAYSLGQFSGEAIKDLALDEDGRVWMISRTKGIVCAEVDGSSVQVRRITSGAGDGNLPSPDVQALAFDQDGELWVGTTDGLAVIYTPYNVFNPGRSIDAQPILREENGVVQKVLGSERISCIAVDGGNRKWVGTQSGGLFLLSPDGLEELMHLTQLPHALGPHYFLGRRSRYGRGFHGHGPRPSVFPRRRHRGRRNVWRRGGLPQPRASGLHRPHFRARAQGQRSVQDHGPLRPLGL